MFTMYQLLLLLGSPSVSKHQEEEEEEADLSEDGEILSDDDDESFKSIPPLAPARFKSLPPPPVLERPKTPIEYDVPMWKPLVSFSVLLCHPWDFHVDERRVLIIGICIGC